MGKEPKSEPELTSSDDETIFVDQVGFVSFETAKKIHASVGAYFTGRAKLTKQKRKNRARAAERARWQKAKPPKA